jgi:hypothetical protein
MSSTALDLDIATLVGDMPAIPCEAPGHGEMHPDFGPATQYGRVNCPDCGNNKIQSYCELVVNHIQNNGLVCCGKCRKTFTARMIVTILGPVNGRTS